MTHKKVRVLIVDDEQTVCEFLHAELSERGYFCTSVLSANKALVKLRTQCFDVALLDIRLPGISGMELLRKIRARHHNTTVIMITVINNIDTAVAAMRLGALDYIVKPFDIDRVSSSIDTALENRKHLLAKRDSRITEEPLNPMDTIAHGVEAKLDSLDGHSRMVTERTIEVARELGITESEIQRWLVARLRQHSERDKVIRSCLDKLRRSPLAQSIMGMTSIHLYTPKSSQSEN